jgi:hypothetical protein
LATQADSKRSAGNQNCDSRVAAVHNVSAGLPTVFGRR